MRVAGEIPLRNARYTSALQVPSTDTSSPQTAHLFWTVIVGDASGLAPSRACTAAVVRPGTGFAGESTARPADCFLPPSHHQPNASFVHVGRSSVVEALVYTFFSAPRGVVLHVPSVQRPIGYAKGWLLDLMDGCDKLSRVLDEVAASPLNWNLWHCFVPPVSDVSSS